MSLETSMNRNGPRQVPWLSKSAARMKRSNDILRKASVMTTDLTLDALEQALHDLEVTDEMEYYQQRIRTPDPVGLTLQPFR